MANTPDIRFKGFREDWKRQKLGDIYQKIRNAFVGTVTPYYVDEGHFYLESNNVKDGQINRNTEIFINDEFYERQKDNWLHTGDLVMVQSGHVGHMAVIPESLNNTAAHALIIIANPLERISPYFVNYQFQNQNTKDDIANITTGNTIKHILASEVKKIEIVKPSYEEQLKMGTYFQQIDSLIALHQRKCDEMSELKKYMLQKMFPKKGEQFPEIRFSGFTEHWEDRKLSEIAEVLDGDRGKNYPTEIDFSEKGHTLFLNASNVTNNGFSFVDKQYISKTKSDSMGNGKIQKDDIILTSRGSLGHVAWYNDDISKKIPFARINSGMLILRKKLDINTSYLYQFLKSEKGQKQISFIGFGSAQPQLTKRGVENLEIVFPIDRKEQERLGCFFTDLDNLITLHQRKYDELKELKKYMLQNMFPKKG